MSAESIDPQRIERVAKALSGAMSAGNREPYSLAFALEAAGLLQSPESAAELVALREAQEAPVVVRRFDIAMEPAPEEEQVLTIGCVAEDGRPVALLLDLDDRPKVARWLALAEGTSMHDSLTGANLARWEEEQENVQLRARVAELEAARTTAAADRDKQIIAWLEKKAREEGTSNKDSRVRATATYRLADKLSRGAVRPACPPVSPEDPHDSTLHHSYALGRDLPEDGAL
ncbi:hypothetical protein ABZ702_06535 [Streptomyces cyaneofuscatus]|uniref:hypothetical protein n=1 Tax=Streptomyces cyaneofuscatus TaxID=66883 RepID=UPI0033CBBB40